MSASGCPTDTPATRPSGRQQPQRPAAGESRSPAAARGWTSPMTCAAPTRAPTIRTIPGTRWGSGAPGRPRRSDAAGGAAPAQARGPGRGAGGELMTVSASTLAAMMDALDVGVIFADRENVIRVFNRTAGEMLQEDAAGRIGTSILPCRPMHRRPPGPGSRRRSARRRTLRRSWLDTAAVPARDPSLRTRHRRRLAGTTSQSTWTVCAAWASGRAAGRAAERRSGRPRASDMAGARECGAGLLLSAGPASSCQRPY